MRQQNPKADEWTADHLRLAIAAAGVALWTWNVDTDQLTMDEQGFELWGLAWSHKVTFEGKRCSQATAIQGMSSPMLLA